MNGISANEPKDNFGQSMVVVLPAQGYGWRKTNEPEKGRA
jgi:hypothetical protein